MAIPLDDSLLGHIVRERSMVRRSIGIVQHQLDDAARGCRDFWEAADATLEIREMVVKSLPHPETIREMIEELKGLRERQRNLEAQLEPFELC